MDRKSYRCGAIRSPNFKPEMVADTVPPPNWRDKIHDEMFPPVWRDSGYSKKNERRLIAMWILRTDVTELADHVLAGVDLENPPFALLSPIPELDEVD